MNAEKKKRLLLLDSLRGISIVNMVVYHACYNYFMILGVDSHWVYYDPVRIWQRYICISFIFISGFSWSFSKNKVKRGLIISGAGMIVTIVTLLFMPNEIIILGILSFIGGAVLLMIPLKKILDKVNAVFVFVCATILFVLFYHIADSYIGIGEFELIKIPENIARIKIFTVIGIPHPDFYSGDYFPLLPWIFIFIAGYSFQKIISNYIFYEKLFDIRIFIFDTIGRYSLQIYMLHQPILMLNFYLTQ